ncbi:mitochondrial carrier [Neoconidiobolus thromboides FSU 785]|nr:mitochondrial carrier [Neoconidiobolus thromboides FSU 785]
MKVNPPNTEGILKYRGEQIKHTLAGAGAGLVASIVTCPLDVVKTRLQNQSKVIPGSTYYKGAIAPLRVIFKEEGINGLYRGLNPTILGYLPSWAIYFSCYHALKPWSTNLLGKEVNSSFVHMISAMIAGCVSTIATTPLWVIKTRIMTQSKTTVYCYNGTIDAFKKIWLQEGISGFYRGLVPSLIGVSHVIVQFPLYERLKVKFAPNDNNDGKIAKGTILMASSISIMAASLCTYPHEVVRTRLQNQTKPPYKYLGVRHACLTIFKEEGASAFYKGFPTNLLRTVPSTTLTLLTYELLCEKLSHWL